MIIHFNNYDREPPPVTADTDQVIREVFQVEHAFPAEFVPAPKRRSLWQRVKDWFSPSRRTSNGRGEAENPVG